MRGEMNGGWEGKKRNSEGLDAHSVWAGLTPLITRHGASTSMYSLTFRVRVVAIATQPVNQLEIRRIVHNWGHPLPLPKLHPGPCNSVGVRPRTDKQTHRRA